MFSDISDTIQSLQSKIDSLENFVHTLYAPPTYAELELAAKSLCEASSLTWDSSHYKDVYARYASLAINEFRRARNLV